MPGPGKMCIWKRICQIHQIRWIKYKYMVWNLIKYKYRLLYNISRTQTFGNSQLEFSPTISLTKTSNTRCTLSFDSWVSIVDKVYSRPTWFELLRVAWDFDSPWIKGPMTPHQSRLYARHIAVIPAAKLWDSITNRISFNRSKNMTPSPPIPRSAAPFCLLSKYLYRQITKDFAMRQDENYVE